MEMNWTEGTWSDGSPDGPEARVMVTADWAAYRDYGPIIASDPAAVYGDLLAEIRSSDLRIVNFEGALMDGCRPIRKGGPNIGMPRAAIDALTIVPFDVACLANNHTCDYGPEGLAQTLDALAAAGVSHVGAGMTEPDATAPLTVQVAGQRLAIVNFCEGEDCTAASGCPGTFGWDPHRAASTVRRLRAEADFVLVIVHAGREHTPVPPPHVVDAYRRIADAGADAVVGHHPHVPQGIEFRGTTPIIYSQGNFVFFQEPEVFYRKVGFMVELGLCGGKLSSLRLIPYTITPAGLRRMPAGELPGFFDCIRRASGPLADLADVRAAWEAFIDHLGPHALARQAESVLGLCRDDAAEGAAKARNVFVTPAHRWLWIDATTRIIEGRMGTSPAWAQELVSEWLTRPSGSAPARQP